MPGTTNFPAALDAGIDLTVFSTEDEPGKEHDVNHNDTWAAVLALQAKVGVDGSAVAASHDKKIADLQSGKTDVGHAHAAADITSGTFADARIAQSNVTQHQAALAIDWDQLTGTMPALIVSDVHTVASEAEQLALAAQEGDIAIRTDENKSYAHNGGTAGTMADWTQLRSPTDAVLSVFGRTGAVSAQSGDYTFAQLAATPTTLAGYGITDEVLDSGDIGSAVQAYNDGLHFISAAYTAGDLGATVGIYKLVAFDGGGGAGGVTMSAYVASIVGSALASDFRGGIGCGTAATANTGTSGNTVPKNDTANTFSAIQTFTYAGNGGTDSPIVVSSASGGRIGYAATGQGADGKNWDTVVSGATFNIRLVNDANNAAAVAYRITRSGLSTSSHEFYTGGGTLRVTFDSSGATIVGGVNYSTTEVHTGILSPAQITANTDNYAPTNHATTRVFRLSTDASRNLTGLAGGGNGRRITISNVGAQALVLAHDVTSTAANRFLCPGSVNYTVPANGSVDCWYDGTSARWRVISN